MKRSITTEEVVHACYEYTELIKKFKREGCAWDKKGNSLNRLMHDTEQSKQDCLDAMKLAEENGLIDYDSIFEIAWPTHKGLAYLKGQK